MSDQLRVAAALRRMSDTDLIALTTARSVNTTHLRDFFDFADALTSPKSMTSAIASLSNRQLDALRNVIAGEKPDAKIASELVGLAVIEKNEKTFSAFDSSIAALQDLSSIRTSSLSIINPDALRYSVEEIDRDARLAIFDVLQALTELILDLEQRFIREVGKRGVGLPDIKRLAGHLRKPNEYAKTIFELALWSDLAQVHNSRWHLGANAESWLNWSDAKRWEHLADYWLQLLGDAGARELQALNAGQSLSETLRASYQFADMAVNSRLKKVTEVAALIGLIANDQVTSWFSQTVGAKISAASKLVVAGLPAPSSKLIVQADLTLIAPSPLPTELEIRLRRIADTEQIGMASSYRLSALSVSNGLESGMSASDIRELLESLSTNVLPQPVDYLLREAEQRFGRLKVGPGKPEGHSQISSEDSILLAEIQNNQKLRPLSLHFTERGELHTRFEPELVYFALREAGYVAVQIDIAGRIVSPTAKPERTTVAETRGSVAQDIARMREQDSKLGSAPDDDDLLRQIQLAIKNKARVLVTITGADGNPIEYLVEPVGLANGRLRAKDRKADIERTLPLASVTGIVLQ